MNYLDGNVLAGPGLDVFAFDPTTTRAQCQSCADIATLGESIVYGGAMGYVVRCRNCDDVLLVIVEQGGKRILNMRGLRWLRLD